MRPMRAPRRGIEVVGLSPRSRAFMGFQQQRTAGELAASTMYHMATLSVKSPLFSMRRVTRWAAAKSASSRIA